VVSFGEEEVRMDEDELKERLLKENQAFKKLFKEHQSYEKKLEKLTSKSFLTDEEVLEEKDLKKRKLALKDRMYLLMTEFRKSL
jgi:uncharacterized protein YdcH (DUF465 family)